MVGNGEIGEIVPSHRACVFVFLCIPVGLRALSSLVREKPPSLPIPFDAIHNT